MADMTTPDHAEGSPAHHAGGMPGEPLGELEHPTHHHDHGHDNSPEAIRKEINKYLVVFGALAGLTIITVAIAQFHLPTWQAVVLALVVASVKGFLVAAFFMHLLSERKLIYAVLVLTVFFFGVLLWGPWHHRLNAQHSYPGYDVNASTSTGDAGHHEGGSAKDAAHQGGH
jgi:cytochrome c oxidase subunit 4